MRNLTTTLRVGDEVFGSLDDNDINVHNDEMFANGRAAASTTAAVHDVDFIASTRIKFRLLELLSQFSYTYIFTIPFQTNLMTTYF